MISRDEAPVLETRGSSSPLATLGPLTQGQRSSSSWHSRASSRNAFLGVPEESAPSSDVLVLGLRLFCRLLEWQVLYVRGKKAQRKYLQPLRASGRL